MANVVIAAANRGLGLGLATRFARRDGNRVFATARQPEEAAELRALAAATGRVSVETLDLCDEASIDAFASRVSREVDRVDVLIHNAAVNGQQPLERLTLELLAEVFTANVFGAAVLVGRLRPALRSGSLVVLMASMQGSITNADGTNGYPYRMSKSALNMFARQLSLDLKPDGIGVLALRPGHVRTRLSGYNAALDVDTSCDGMLRVIDGFSFEQTGQFIGYDGKPSPW